MSNRDRIARAAEEARVAAEEKAAKKAAKKPSTPRAPRAAKLPVRMKIVWDVCNTAGTAVKTFAYPDKAVAEAETETLTRSTGKTHILRPSKVPMD